MIEILKM